MRGFAFPLVDSNKFRIAYCIFYKYRTLLWVTHFLVSDEPSGNSTKKQLVWYQYHML